MSNGNGKLPPFLWLSRAATTSILAEFPRQGERSTVLSIYTALALIASEQNLGGRHAGIEASRAEVARKAGVNPRTLDAYTKRMETSGLVVVRRRRVGKVNLPNLYDLPDSPGKEPGGELS